MILNKDGNKITEVAFTDINGQRVILSETDPLQREAGHFEMLNPQASHSKDIGTDDRDVSRIVLEKFGIKKLHESEIFYP